MPQLKSGLVGDVVLFIKPELANLMVKRSGGFCGNVYLILQNGLNVPKVVVLYYDNHTALNPNCIEDK